MGFLENLGKKVADAGQNTVQKTKGMSEIVRLNSLVSKEESRLEQLYTQIGKIYVGLHAVDYEEGFAGAFQEVREAEQNIQNCKQQIDEIKNSWNREETGTVVPGKCPNCGAAVPDGISFCISCGSPIPQPQPQAFSAVAANQASGKCPKCGAAVPDGGRYCTSCGSPVPQPEVIPSAPADKYCANCGNKLAADAAFCEQCGTRVL